MSKTETLPVAPIYLACKGKPAQPTAPKVETSPCLHPVSTCSVICLETEIRITFERGWNLGGRGLKGRHWWKKGKV